MCSSEGFLLPDADAFCRRTNDHVLQMRKLRSPMEGKLIPLFAKRIALCVLLLTSACRGAEANSSAFKIVVFMCVWKRPVLTSFILEYYSSLKPVLLSEHNIELDMFITGSDNSSTPQLARRYNAGYAVHPNRPLGSKHNLGLRSLRQHFLNLAGIVQTPDAVTIVGSDDLLNAMFFVKAKELMIGPVDPLHVVGLRDIYFFDLHSLRLVYTTGYREFVTPISGTIGCGRIFSWSMLNTLGWELWDWGRDHSLDQSTIRLILQLVPQIVEVSSSLSGADHQIAAVDLKTDAFKQGVNIWGFNQVVQAGQNGSLQDFQEREAQSSIDEIFGVDFFRNRILQLRSTLQHAAVAAAVS